MLSMVMELLATGCEICFTIRLNISQGANSYGQLGSGHKEDTLLPARCLLQPGVDIGQLRQITGGGGHSTLLTGRRVLLFGGLVPE